MRSSTALASLAGALALTALVLLGNGCGIRTGSTAVRVPDVRTTLDRRPIVPDCEKNFEVQNIIEVRYPAGPAGAPASPVEIDVGAQDLVNVQPVRIEPDEFTVTRDSEPTSQVRSMLIDACMQGFLDITVDATATGQSPREDIEVLPAVGRVRAVDFDVTQEIIVDAVDEQQGLFEADFELACCSTSAAEFDVLVENERNIADLDIDATVTVGTRLSCPRTGPPKRYKLVGRKTEPELGASFVVRVKQITPATPECVFETVAIP